MTLKSVFLPFLDPLRVENVKRSSNRTCYESKIIFGSRLTLTFFKTFFVLRLWEEEKKTNQMEVVVAPKEHGAGRLLSPGPSHFTWFHSFHVVLCVFPLCHCLVLPTGLQRLHLLGCFRTLHSRDRHLIRSRWVVRTRGLFMCANRTAGQLI